MYSMEAFCPFLICGKILMRCLKESLKTTREVRCGQAEGLRPGTPTKGRLDPSPAQPVAVLPPGRTEAGEETLEDTESVALFCGPGGRGQCTEPHVPFTCPPLSLQCPPPGLKWVRGSWQ